MAAVNADIESANGSQTVSISDQPVKKETFSIQNAMRIHEIKCRREIGNLYLAMAFLLSFLSFICIYLYLMGSLVLNTHSMVFEIQSQLDKLPKLDSSSSNGIQEIFEMKKEKFLKEEKEKLEEALNKVLKEVKPIVIKEEMKEKEKKEEIPIKNSFYKINSANYLFGATVDTSISSPSDLPEEISYQHSKWNGTVPYGSPKLFNVFACLDFKCEKTEPLISNCEYKSSGQIQEQIFNISSNSKTKSIGKVQFRFLKNHGNVKKTCVSLVRVYGESADFPKMKEYKTNEYGMTCADFRDTYHNNPTNYHKTTLVLTEYGGRF
uniref:SUN domain-containing protein n=1 Tax=Caenorhabditis tropicalis TaxID=1561998 RepID=A0A1I7TCD4_9PELO